VKLPVVACTPATIKVQRVGCVSAGFIVPSC
jgi:hypothetical protein